MEISEIKELVKEAVDFADRAESFVSQTEDSAEVCAQISIAKSLAAIAGILEKVTNGQRSINVYDISRPEI